MSERPETAGRAEQEAENLREMLRTEEKTWSRIADAERERRLLAELTAAQFQRALQKISVGDLWVSPTHMADPEQIAARALDAPLPSLAELRELVAVADSAIGFECCPQWVHGGPHADSCPRRKFLAILAAYPFLREGREGE